ncbi:MAG: type II toxin-antitoxin system RelE/ParE family toxin [Burkholderiaceae bacterium]|jgi:phage-related protein|nr:type II toxin-antitoxin system RelE/ParE family toxin [Burkholderiaceae bacterium]
MYTIDYYSDEVRLDINNLPLTIRAHYKRYTDRMMIYGSHLGEPHTKALGKGLFELRIKGGEGIARVFYCTLVGKKIVMLHSFIKKTPKTPPQEMETAIRRMKEIKNDA